MSKSNEPGWLANYRERAMKFFSESELKSRYTDMKKIDFASEPHSGVVKEVAVPKNALVHHDASVFQKAKAGDGVIFLDIAEAIESYPDLVKKYLREPETKTEAVNAAFFQAGIFLLVPAGKEFGGMHSIALGDGSRTFMKNIIVAEEGSKINIIEMSSSEGSSFLSMSSDLFVNSGASLSQTDIQNLSDHSTMLSEKSSFVGNNGAISLTGGTFGGGLVYGRRNTFLQKEGAQCNDVEVFFSSGNQHMDISSDLIHEARNTKGDVFVRGAIKNSSRAIFQGLIRIEKAAQSSSAFLSEHSLMLDKEARADVIPSLEIIANDVKCGHSASVGQLDENELFYLTSKGLSEVEAKKMIVLGFLDPALKRLTNEHIKHTILETIESKWKSK